MSNRPSFLGKDITAALKKKGFEDCNTHHKQLFLVVDGQRTAIRTRISHGRTTYERDLWSALKKQLCLHDEPEACVDLISCKLDHMGYVDLLRSKQRI